jgi:hypothetical protein
MTVSAILAGGSNEVDATWRNARYVSYCWGKLHGNLRGNRKTLGGGWRHSPYSCNLARVAKRRGEWLPLTPKNRPYRGLVG